MYPNVESGVQSSDHIFLVNITCDKKHTAEVNMKVSLYKSTCCMDSEPSTGFIHLVFLLVNN